MPDLNQQLRAIGVSRDAESPGGKGVLVSFNRAPTDDELRALHDQLRQHGSAPDFESAWAAEVAANGGTEIGADYKHWMLKGWNARRQHGSAAQAVAWRRATKHGWEYRDRAPTASTRGDGWMPLCDPAAPPVADADDEQRVWIVNAENGDHVMMCPAEPSAETLALASVKIGQSVTATEYLLRPSALSRRPAAAAEVAAEQPAEQGEFGTSHMVLTGKAERERGKNIAARTMLDNLAGQGKDSERHRAIGAAIERACKELPDGFEVEVMLKRDAGTVTLYCPEGYGTDEGHDADTFDEQINHAIDAAMKAGAHWEGK